MPRYAEDDLISLASSSGEAGAAAAPAPLALAEATPEKMAEARPKPATFDSFSGLTDLMRARKPVTQTLQQKGLQKAQPKQGLLIDVANDKDAREVAKGYANTPIWAPTATKLTTSNLIRHNYDSVAKVAEPQRKPSQETRTTVHTSNDGHTSHVPDYRAGKIVLLEDLMKEINEFNVGDEPAAARKPSPLLKGFEKPEIQLPTAKYPTLSQNRWPGAVDDDKPIVRMTQEVYDSMNKAIKDLTSDKRQLAEDKDHLQRRLKDLESSATATSTMYGQARYEIDQSKDQKLALFRLVKSRDEDLHEKQIEIDVLKSKMSGDHAIDDLYEIQSLKEQLAQQEKAAKSHAAKAQDLAAMNARRQTAINELMQQLADKHQAYDELRDDFDELRAQTKKDTVNAIKQQLRDKSADYDRLRNEFRDMEQRWRIANRATERLNNQQDLLKGQAMLVKPRPKTKLPSTVLDCIECQYANLDCDHNIVCIHCKAAGKTCARWRCSMEHIAGGCQEAPCRLRHDASGWLVSPTNRPKW